MPATSPRAGFTHADTLVGIAASGRTPYVLGALAHARQLAPSPSPSPASPTPSSAAADIAIAPVTGPEVLTGSTRMKAGTATKLVLNMLSTAVMVRTGAVYGNLMVNVQPTNAKLVDRARRIIAAATGCDDPQAARSPRSRSGKSVKAAIVMHQLSVDPGTAEQKLANAGGSLRAALKP